VCDSDFLISAFIAIAITAVVAINVQLTRPTCSSLPINPALLSALKGNLRLMTPRGPCAPCGTLSADASADATIDLTLT
jgi:hypothetical protein